MSDVPNSESNGRAPSAQAGRASTIRRLCQMCVSYCKGTLSYTRSLRQTSLILSLCSLYACRRRASGFSPNTYPTTQPQYHIQLQSQPTGTPAAQYHTRRKTPSLTTAKAWENITEPLPRRTQLLKSCVSQGTGVSTAMMSVSSETVDLARLDLRGMQEMGVKPAKQIHAADCRRNHGEVRWSIYTPAYMDNRLWCLLAVQGLVHIYVSRVHFRPENDSPSCYGY